MYTKEVIRLHINTWVGTCAIGAEHWYGKLLWHTDQDDGNDWKEHELEYVLNQQQADRMNRKDEYCTYKAGEESSRFFLRDEVVRVALAQWQTIVPTGRVLIVCDRCSCGVCEILAGPPKLVRLGNQLWKADEEEGYDWTKKRGIIDKQWEKLFNRFGFLDHFMD